MFFLFFFQVLAVVFVNSLNEGAFCGAVSDPFVQWSQSSSVWSLNGKAQIYCTGKANTLVCRHTVVQTTPSYPCHLSPFHTCLHTDIKS